MAFEEANLKGQFADANVGDVVLFGNYEQDNNGNNGAEAIEWIVVEKSETEVKLLSKSVLTVMGYASNNEVRWEMSNVRAFLNNDFFAGAFNAQEQEVLAVNTVKAEKNPQAMYYDNDPGADTEDKVYILSYSEYGKYKDVNGVTEYLAGTVALIAQNGLKGVAELNQMRVYGTTLPCGVRPVITVQITEEAVEEVAGNMADEVVEENRIVTE